jgi:putative cell wall-binding protein
MSTVADLHRARGRAVAAMVLAVVLALPGAASPEETPLPRMVVAAGDHDYRLVIPGESWDADVRGVLPRWSPDGRWIAFREPAQTYLMGSGQHLWIVAADGTGARRLLQTAPSEGAPSWSPDGRQIAVADGRGITVVAAEGGSRQITAPGSHMVADQQPVWSPDGQRIAFVRSDQLHVILVGGGTSVGAGQGVRGIRSIDWAPDSRYLVFTAGRSYYGGGLYTVRFDGANHRRIVSSFETGLLAQDAVFSPDGLEIAYAANPADAETQNEWEGRADAGIYVTDRAGTAPRQVATTDGTEHGPAWTPDGSKITFFAHNDDSGCHCFVGDAWVVARDADDLRRVEIDRYEVHVRDPRPAPGVTLRVAGPNRMETSVAVSRLTRTRADTVVIARSDHYADALAGGPLAARMDAPLLLTTPWGLTPVVSREITRLGATRAIILGSEAAVSRKVADAIRTNTSVSEVERVGGADRFATARLVAAMVGGDRAYVVEGRHRDPGRGWPDAVAVSGLAARQGRPILLTTRDVLPQPTREALQGRSAVTIVGSTEAVSGEVERAIAAEGPAVDRIQGPNRYRTSLAVAEAAVADGADGQQVWVATGRNWPDALTLGPAVAARDGVLMLADGRDAQRDTHLTQWVSAQEVTRAFLAGGTSVLSPGLATAVERAAR